MIGFSSMRVEPYGCFSNWYEIDFVVDGITFHSSEQYMMYVKCLTMGSIEAANKVLQAPTPGKAKYIARHLVGDIEAWDKQKYELVKVGIKEKFRQNKRILDVLLSTGDQFLAECTTRDKIWGIGRKQENIDEFDPTTWNGQNLLGKALMEVREELRLEVNKEI